MEKKKVSGGGRLGWIWALWNLGERLEHWRPEWSTFLKRLVRNNSKDRGAWWAKSMGLQRVGHKWVPNTHTHTRNQWNPLLEQVWGTVSGLLRENILLVTRKACCAGMWELNCWIQHVVRAGWRGWVGWGQSWKSWPYCWELPRRLSSKKVLAGTSLVVQWLRLHFHCGGHEFEPWSGN